MMKPYKSTLRKGKLGSKDEKTGILQTTDRGLYRTEIGAMLAAPWDVLPEAPTVKRIERAERDALLLALLWDTWARIDELMNVAVEEIDIGNRVIHLTKTKRKRVRGEAVMKERDTTFSKDTRVLLLKYLRERRSGPLFELSDRAARDIVRGYAESLGIQKVVGYDTRGNPRHLITPKAFREAGEAYAIMEGMDRDMAANLAGHTVGVQERNYAKYDSIRARDLVDKHRPSLNTKGSPVEAAEIQPKSKFENEDTERCVIVSSERDTESPVREEE